MLCSLLAPCVRTLLTSTKGARALDRMDRHMTGRGGALCTPARAGGLRCQVLCMLLVGVAIDVWGDAE
jgi:hypothetical protein